MRVLWSVQGLKGDHLCFLPRLGIKQFKRGVRQGGIPAAFDDLQNANFLRICGDSNLRRSEFMDYFF